MLMLACTLSANAFGGVKSLVIFNTIIFGGALALAVIGSVLDRRHIRRMARRNAPPFALECSCPARQGICVCADSNGVRNPRGAGRGRMRGAA